jgi:Helix-hairpin-helix motif
MTVTGSPRSDQRHSGARNAESALAEMPGSFTGTLEELMTLPGVGRKTANVKGERRCAADGDGEGAWAAEYRFGVSRSRPLADTSAADSSIPPAPVKMPSRSRFMARMRSLTEPYIESRAPDKIAAVVISTTGATIAWIAVTVVRFTGPAYETSTARYAPLPRLENCHRGSPCRAPCREAANLARAFR